MLGKELVHFFAYYLCVSYSLDEFVALLRVPPLNKCNTKGFIIETGYTQEDIPSCES